MRKSQKNCIMNNEKTKLGYLEGWASTVLNTVLFAFKYWVGYMSGSVSMIADAWHTLSDTLTSVIVIVGFWISAKRPDERHPFGHGRAEVISALTIGTLLAVVGFEFIKQSIFKLYYYKSATFGNFAIIVFLLSAVLKEALAQFAFWAGKKNNSGSLIADGWHHRSDSIASALIVVGALLGSKLWWIDGVMGIMVSLLIMYAALDIFKNATNLLMGGKLSPELETRIKDIIKRTVPEVEDSHHFHIHCYGEHSELTFHVKMPLDKTLEEAHREMTAIENSIRKELNIEATIHSEPFRPKTG